MEWSAFEEAVKRLAAPNTRRDIVYLLLSLVPQGCTITYGALAELAGTGPRAIGAFMKANRSLVLIPCHRVVSVRGLGGFSRGLRFKKRLLELEEAITGEGRLACVIKSVDDYWRTVERSGGEQLTVDV